MVRYGQIFGDYWLRVALKTVEGRGLAGFHMMYSLRSLVLPLLLPVVDLLLVPYFLARCAGWWWWWNSGVSYDVASYTICTLLVRYCYHTYLLLHLLRYLGSEVVISLRKTQEELQGTRALKSGAQLVNRD